MCKHLLLIVSLFWSLFASGELITYRYTAITSTFYEADCVSYVNNQCQNYQYIATYPDSSIFYNGILMKKGGEITGRFVLDTETPLSTTVSVGLHGLYAGAIVSNDVSIANFDYLSSSTSARALSVVDNAYGEDGFSFWDGYTNNDWNTSFYFQLIDRSTAAFNSISIPEVLNLEDFTNPNFGIAFQRTSDGDILQLGGSIIELERVTVSEPSTWSLIMLILAIVLFSHAYQKVHSYL